MSESDLWQGLWSLPSSPPARSPFSRLRISCLFSSYLSCDFRLSAVTQRPIVGALSILILILVYLCTLEQNLQSLLTFRSVD